MFKLSFHGAATESKIKHTESKCKFHCYLKTCLTIFILYILCVFGTLNDWERNDSVLKLSPWKWNIIRNEEADVHCKKTSVYNNNQGNLFWRWNGLQKFKISFLEFYSNVNLKQIQQTINWFIADLATLTPPSNSFCWSNIY